ncbi:MAG: hypothetical protein IJ412_11235 [Oscillospiraceae bacterium]|nr:hypothetical protein [Oscillospiraceae bacterium]
MFQKALPVWVPFENRQDELNSQLVFRARVSTVRGTKLSLAAVDFYRLWVNGRFAGFGPARTAKNCARVDVYDLTPYANDMDIPDEIVIEAAGYGCCALSTARQKPFLCAELTADGEPVLFTGRDFSCWRNVRRVKKTERYSVQRHFSEIWDLRIADRFADEYRVQTVPVERSIRFIPRGVPMPHCALVERTGYVSAGSFAPDETLAPQDVRIHAYSFAPEKEPDWGYFPDEEVEEKPYRFLNAQKQTVTAGAGSLPLELAAGQWVLLDLGRIEVGFIRALLESAEESTVIIGFSEVCDGKTLSFNKMNVQNVLQYHLPAGIFTGVESFEPYGLRWAAVYVKSGRITLDGFGLRTFERDMSGAVQRSFADPGLQAVYTAALRSFAHNAVDLYTDCPTRERAGWLCDSFFTGRAEYFFFGETPVEDAFLENYLLYENEGEFPVGVLPMCYPSDPHQNNKFIPQWDMWFVMEVCEYLAERHPEKDRAPFLPAVRGILDFLAGYENSDGLLERLPSWNFVEWSKANTWTQDVSYPTNFLYAELLCRAEAVFGLAGLGEKAARIRAYLLTNAFNGEVFVDNAVRDEAGVLHNTANVSEAGQYYAALYGGFSLDEPRWAKLRTHIADGFAAFAAADTGCDFCPANAFIGLYLRMNVLLQLDDPAIMRRDLVGFFGGMSALTGTLWEYRTPHNSLDHGFASYAALCLPLADRI